MNETTPEQYRAEARRFHDMTRAGGGPRKEGSLPANGAQLPHACGGPGTPLPARWRRLHQSPQGPEVRDAPPMRLRQDRISTVCNPIHPCHICSVAEKLPHPYLLKIRSCTEDAGRFRWEILDSNGVLDTSFESFATGREARDSGQRELQSLVEIWNKK
jgi:hypothetical protein